MAAARKDGMAEMVVSEKGDTSWMVMNDYYYANPEVAAVPLPIAPDAVVKLVNSETGQPSEETSSVQDLVASKSLHNFPFLLRVKDGKIVALNMKWVP